jgi:ribosomal-protein-alanine N-acetyltransferase
MIDQSTAFSLQMKLYQSSVDEVRCLRSIAAEWVAQDQFWDFDQVLEFVHKGKGLIHYLGNERSWQAAALITSAGSTADLCYLYVRVDSRGKGLGRELLRQAMTQLFTHGAVEEICLEVKPNNSYAVQIYEDLGFSVIGTRKQYYRDGSDALVMKCQKSESAN